MMAICCAMTMAASAQNDAIPHLEKTKNSVQLMVDGKPFIMLGGELHNSSTGSSHYMADIWQRMAAKNLNTVIAAVSWELVEPQEGKFDFRLVDDMLAGARKADLKLVLLWFGSWKNGVSTYVPGWVKKDLKRFPLVRYKDGEPSNTLSPFGQNSLKADLRAFSELMKHIKKADSEKHTVIAIQIENELGTLDMMSSYMNKDNRAMRDYSDMANKAFKGEVPTQLLQYLKANKKSLQPAIDSVWNANGQKMKGTWEEVFGKSQPAKKVNRNDPNLMTDMSWQKEYPWLTEEMFNAWYYASYVEQLAAAAKEIYPIPLYVNAWLKQLWAREPGKYPSGGPQPHLFDIWHAAAPHVDLLGPDLYATTLFDWVLSGYDQPGNPVIMPETKSSADGAARSFYAFGRYNMLCYSPFGIDGGGLTLSADPNDHSYDKAYGLLRHLTPYIAKYNGTDKKNGLLLDEGRETDKIVMGKYTITARPFSTRASQAVVGVSIAEREKEAANVAGALIIQTGEDEFLVAGGIGEIVVGFRLTNADSKHHAFFESVDEITFTEDGQELLHRLNGDETAYGGPVIPKGEVKAFRVRLYEY